ncbi:MAG: hypothetical protein HYV63_00135 [Candidatus Schekmanbacteria bacterium]|nr:hypothetical protein [Candidatus Schekmanbacteria bacterium]
MNERRQNPSAGGIVVGALLAIGVLLGVVSFRGATTSGRMLRDDLARIASRSHTLTAEACVDEAIHWHRHCGAAVVMCDAFLPRVTATCLAGADRTDYCRSVAADFFSTRFDFARCSARGFAPRAMKTCALAYRAVEAHCRRVLGGGVALEPHAAEQGRVLLNENRSTGDRR